MKRTLIFMLFLALVLVQWIVPAGMILQRETVLEQGREYKFHVVPVDPYDAFRGRFVQIGITAGPVSLAKDEEIVSGKSGYVVFETDPEGFAVVKNVLLKRPEGEAYLKVGLRKERNGKVSIIWPFDRYYMEESAAPVAEKRYRERTGNADVYILARIHKGTGVITGLYLDGLPVERWIATQ
ncbi:MAG TPA: GDYXXLXY domain-containing protein [Candidatus Hydrogenedentes bacterium]|jgi:uncharacterized membrane-anchored protein|nr:GDYXXLXY domain-containing protein [Candidatus Hydrogenedentota bacterium]